MSKKKNTYTARCKSCGRKYKTNEAMVRLVQLGRLESLCGYCDESHDDK